MNADNTVSFDPKGIVGRHTFTYTISDGLGGTDTATVTVYVKPDANKAPNAVADTRTTGRTTPIVIKVLNNDTDPDGNALTVTAVSQSTAGTSVTLNADNTVSFDPNGIIGSHTFSYTISDGLGGTDTANVTITASGSQGGHDNYPDTTDDYVTVSENGSILIHVLANDSDADGDVLVLGQIDSPNYGTVQKILGSILYTPNANFTGTDVFYYSVHDGHGHDNYATVNITVTPAP